MSAPQPQPLQCGPFAAPGQGQQQQGHTEALRPLRKQTSVPTDNSSWLSKVATWGQNLKTSLSALDSPSSMRALGDGDGGTGEQRSSMNSYNRTSRPSRDSAYTHAHGRLGVATGEAHTSKDLHKATKGVVAAAATSSGVMGKLRRYISVAVPTKSTDALKRQPGSHSLEPTARQAVPLPAPSHIPPLVTLAHQSADTATLLQLPDSAAAVLPPTPPPPSPTPQSPAMRSMVMDRDSAQQHASPPVQHRPEPTTAQQQHASSSVQHRPEPTAQQASSPPPAPTPALPPARKSTILAMSQHLPPGMARPVWRIEDYVDLQQLHSGYASFVMKATCRHTGRAVALKIYQPELLHQISQHQLMREARLHVQLSHPHVIQLYAAFQQEDGVVLVQEFAEGGDLLHYLATLDGGRLSERKTVRMVIQPLVEALRYLHSKGIIHRDVKLENILFSRPDMCLKLADFGLCLSYREERCVTRAGTLDYMAPEILRCPTKDYPEDNKDRLDLAYTCAVDVWSVGVLAYELLCGMPPFTRRDRQETERLIMDGSRPQFLVHVSAMAVNFIYSCLEHSAHLRPSASQLLSYAWLRTGLASSSSMPDNTRVRAQLPAVSSRPNLAARLPGIRPATSEARQQVHEGQQMPLFQPRASINADAEGKLVPFAMHPSTPALIARPEVATTEGMQSPTPQTSAVPAVALRGPSSRTSPGARISPQRDAASSKPGALPAVDGERTSL